MLAGNQLAAVYNLANRLWFSYYISFKRLNKIFYYFVRNIHHIGMYSICPYRNSCLIISIFEIESRESSSKHHILLFYLKSFLNSHYCNSNIQDLSFMKQFCTCNNWCPWSSNARHSDTHPKIIQSEIYRGNGIHN